MWEHDTFIINFNSGFDLANKLTNRMNNENKEWEFLQVIIVQNTAEAVVVVRRSISFAQELAKGENKNA